MVDFRQTVNSLLQLLLELADLIIAGILTIESWLRGQLTQLGVPQNVQTAILLALAVLLVLGSLRLFGGLIRVALVLVLILIAFRMVIPIVPHY